MPTAPGLRERKKQATRTALSRAAWHLMVEHGLPAVTPDAVAELADVSQRTFRNYFLSPAEAIVEAVIPRLGIMAEALRGRPAGEPVWDSLIAVLPGAVTTLLGTREDFVILVRVTREDPMLLAQQLAAIDRIRRELTEAVMERTGVDDLASRLLAEAAGAALRTSVEVWARGDGRVSLGELVTQSLTQMRAGIPRGEYRPVNRESPPGQLVHR